MKMKISYNWLKQFIKIDGKSEETAALLTDLGLEVEMVEKYQSVKGGLEGIVIGHVLTCASTTSDRQIKITTVDVMEVPYKLFVVLQMLLQVKKVPVATRYRLYTIKRRNCIHY
jgi:phenylalanyl-tRNA synthetase beta chain